MLELTKGELRFLEGLLAWYFPQGEETVNLLRKVREAIHHSEIHEEMENHTVATMLGG